MRQGHRLRKTKEVATSDRKWVPQVAQVKSLLAKMPTLNAAWQHEEAAVKEAKQWKEGFDRVAKTLLMMASISYEYTDQSLFSRRDSVEQIATELWFSLRKGQKPMFSCEKFTKMHR